MALTLTKPPLGSGPRLSRPTLLGSVTGTLAESRAYSGSGPGAGLGSDTLFTLSRVGDSAVVSLCCTRIEESHCDGLHTYLLGLAKNSGGRLALEMAGVRNFSCAWINALMMLTRECRALGGQLVIFGLRPEHRTILERTGLVRFLTLASSRTKALELLGSATIAPWRLAVARLLDIPVALPFEEPARTGLLAKAA